MPPPPPKEDSGPGTALLDGMGHWVWERDEGFEALNASTRGFIRNGIDNALDWLTRRAPEHWFVKLSDARWEFRDSTPSLWKSSSGKITPTILEIGRVGPETEVRGLDGAMYRGHVKTYWEGKKLCVHTYSVRKDERVDYVQTMEVVEGEYLHTVEDQARGISGARYFKRYPYYWIDNQTRKTLRLMTYSANEILYLSPAMKTEVRAHLQCIEASGPHAEREQAYFVMTKRDATTGAEEKTCFLELEAFQTYTLNEDEFE